MKNEGNVTPKVERVSEDETNVVQNFMMRSLEFVVRHIELDIDEYGVRILDVNARQFFAHPNFRTAQAKFCRKAGVITFYSLIPLEVLQMTNGSYQPGAPNGDLINVSLKYDTISAFVQAYHIVESLGYQISS